MSNVRKIYEIVLSGEKSLPICKNMRISDVFFLRLKVDTKTDVVIKRHARKKVTKF